MRDGCFTRRFGRDGAATSESAHGLFFRLDVDSPVPFGLGPREYAVMLETRNKTRLT
jgi:hypothetical protein